MGHIVPYTVRAAKPTGATAGQPWPDLSDTEKVLERPARGNKVGKKQSQLI